MSSNEQEEVRRIARRIAEQIAGESGGAKPDGARTANSNSNEVSALQAELAKLNRRLAQLEAQVSSDGRDGDNTRRDAATMSNSGGTGVKSIGHTPQVHAPHLMGGGGTYVSAVHPSEQRFGINEAVTELVDYFEAGKTCEMEPGGKPCDHCGMCSARGF